MTVRWNTPEQEAAIMRLWFRDEREREELRLDLMRRRQQQRDRQEGDDFEAAWEWG